MEETKVKNLIVEIGDSQYKIIGPNIEDICNELDMSSERFIELLSRDAYCPTLSDAPTSLTITYVDTDGSTNKFREGQLCRWIENDNWRMAVCKEISNNYSRWYFLPANISELNNDAGYLTQHQNISHLATKEELSDKVDKVEGKTLSSEDFSTFFKDKLTQLNVVAEDADGELSDVPEDVCVKYVTQSLTEEQKNQVRENLGIPSIEYVINLFEELRTLILNNTSDAIAVLDKAILDMHKLQ